MPACPGRPAGRGRGAVTTVETRLHAAVEAMDHDTIVTMLAPLSEPERAALDPALAALIAAWEKADWEVSRLPPWRRPPGVPTHLHIRAGYLARVGTAELADLPDIGYIWKQGDPTDHQQLNRHHMLRGVLATLHGHQVLCDRRPPWLKQAAAGYLRYGHWMWDPYWNL